MATQPNEVSEEVVDEVETEVYGRENKKPPRAKRYRIRIDKDPKVVETRHITGEKLLDLVGKKPDAWRLFQKMHGGQMREIEAATTVDLGEQGVERFTTMEKAQQPGEQSTVGTEAAPAAPRRAFRLPEEDEGFLDSLGLRWETIQEGKVNWLLVHEYQTPAGYNHGQVTAAFRIESGYPPAQLDMVYVFPPLARVDGKPIVQLSPQALEGKTYQRWSRHYGWREGVDNLALHYLRVEDWLLASLK